MAFPPELATYRNEDDFIQRFLTTLLRRLGFSVVANHHSNRSEFGKDVLFAEIDRFSHIRDRGLQVKCEPSIVAVPD